MPRPMNTNPACFTASFLSNTMIISMPAMAKTGPGLKVMDRSREVTVVPMLAPTMTPTAWASVSS